MNASPHRSGPRRALAHERARVAWDQLEHCCFCAHRCGVDRLRGQKGLCRAGAQVRWFAAQTEVGEEAELCPCFTLSLSGCDLRCDFCVTGRDSWNPAAGDAFDAPTMAGHARQALDRGARTIQILGGEPTIHLPSVLELVALLPETAHLVWKTNGHGSEDARQLLDGLFDTWVVDFKFGNDACADRLARVPRYLEVISGNLLWAYPRTNLIIRHLLMPGHVECCWRPIANWLARKLPGVKVSLRTGFWPAWRSRLHPELTAGLSPGEVDRAAALAAANGLHLLSSGLDEALPNWFQRTPLPTEGEILLLPDGRVLSHNTSPALAGLMHSLGRNGKETDELSG